MRVVKVILSVLVAACAAPAAWGHGFSLSLVGNALEGTSNDFPGNGNPHLFLAQLSAGLLNSTHGAAGSTLFGDGKELAFDVYGPLWYSSGDGNPAQLADPGIALAIESASLIGSISIDRDSTFTAGYAITGDTSHEFLWTLSGGSIPTGVYGVAYRVDGNPVGGDPYDPTPLLVPTYMTPDFEPGDVGDPNSPVNLAQGAIFAAAVPEPSGIVPAAVAIGALGGCGWRAARRRRASRAGRGSARRTS